MGLTLVATPCLIRFLICSVDGHEWIAISGRNTYHRKQCICIDQGQTRDMIVICDA